MRSPDAFHGHTPYLVVWIVTYWLCFMPEIFLSMKLRSKRTAQKSDRGSMFFVILAANLAIGIGFLVMIVFPGFSINAGWKILFDAGIVVWLAGAFFRFVDTYSKLVGGQLQLAMDPPTVEPSAKEGLISVRDFSIKGEAALDRLAAGGAAGAPGGVSFSGLRAEFTRQNGQLTIREGVLKGLTIGGTIEGSIDSASQVRMSGTFVPLYGINNVFGQIPVLGLFLGGGSNEGLFGVTYEVVGTLGQPVLRVNPISAIFPGVSRKIMEFNTGKQNNPVEFPSNNN